MAVSEAKKKSNAKYVKNHYESLIIRVKKGEKEIIKEHAEKCGESLNGFVNRAIKQTMEDDEYIPGKHWSE